MDVHSFEFHSVSDAVARMGLAKRRKNGGAEQVRSYVGLTDLVCCCYDNTV
jgi:hypothetical protein